MENSEKHAKNFDPYQIGKRNYIHNVIFLCLYTIITSRTLKNKKIVARVLNLKLITSNF